jgi:hypothetical protein
MIKRGKKGGIKGTGHEQKREWVNKFMSSVVH